MNLSALECYAIDKLQCGISDLCMLENIYSTLGEDCYSAKDLVDESRDLNDLLYNSYTYIAERVQEAIFDMLDIEEGLDVVINDEVKYIEFTEDNKEALSKLANKLTENYPYCNCLDTSFQSDLDQTVDFEASLRSNIEYLVTYWAEDEDNGITFSEREE